MAKSTNQVFELAHWFVESYLCRRWDSRSCGMHMKHASLLVTPKEGVETFDPERIRKTLLAAQAGIFKDFKPASANVLLCVLWCNPRLIDRDISKAIP